jgi:hypothetical protein
MSRSYISSPPQARAWPLVGLVKFYILNIIRFTGAAELFIRFHTSIIQRTIKRIIMKLLMYPVV